MQTAIVHYGRFGIVIELQRHLAASVREQSRVRRRTSLPRHSHAGMFALPLRYRHRVCDVESDVLKVHASIVVENSLTDNRRVKVRSLFLPDSA